MNNKGLDITRNIFFHMVNLISLVLNGQLQNMLLPFLDFTETLKIEKKS